MMKKLGALFLALAVCLSMISFMPSKVQADTEEIHISMDGFEITFYDDGGGFGSLWIMGYTGTATEITLPTEIHYNGKVYQGAGCIAPNAFEGNKTIKKVIIPKGYEAIQSKAFYGCTNLTEVIIGDAGILTPYYLENNIFGNCPNLKTYRIGINKFPDGVEYFENDFGIGKDADGNILPGVTAYIVEGSDIDQNLQVINNKSNGNKIKLVYSDDPASAANVTCVIPGGSTSGGSDSGRSGNEFEKGASFDDADKAVTAWSSESDPEGSIYSGLQLKATKIKKTSVKISWKKVSGAAKYVVYGNKCGKKNKYVKLATATGASKAFKKIGSAKIKKGTYYKFIVVAVDKNNKVVSTSKTVHVATKGGKVGNDKKVTTKAKKSKVSIAAKKTFKLGAKEVPVSKKLKVKRHRKVKYESTNEAVATVSAKGVIKGIAKGSCEVYAYAQNGVSAKIKVTVK